MASLVYISSTIGYQFADVIHDLGMRFQISSTTGSGSHCANLKRHTSGEGEGKVAMIAHLENAGAIGNVLID
jgi:hypothetical protein